MVRSIPEDSAARFALVGCTNFVVSFTAFFLSFNYLPPAPSPRGSSAPARIGAPAAGGRGECDRVSCRHGEQLLAEPLVDVPRDDRQRAAAGAALRVVSLFSLTMSTVVTFALVDVVGLPSLAVWMPLTALVVVVNYVGCKHWAFAPRAVGTEAR